MITVTIDGKTIEAAEGSTIIAAAEAVGIYIPHLCHSDGFAPYGACRMCIVEVEGMRVQLHPGSRSQGTRGAGADGCRPV